MSMYDDFEQPKNSEPEEVHDSLCPVYKGSCCTWLEKCSCQCMCDFITEIRSEEQNRAGQRAFDFAVRNLFESMETADWIDGIVAAARGEAS